MLKIGKLTCTINSKKILDDLNLVIKPGEIHILMGPNGSGKSTLAKVIGGFDNYKIENGTITLDKKSIVDLDITERARIGLFIAYQYPIEVPGVNFRNFLRLAYNSNLPKEQQISVFKFKELLEQNAKMFNISRKIIDRDLNHNLSGGEKKKMEMLQMAVLQPKYAILDEIDSGLDVDAVKEIFTGINAYRKSNSKLGLIIITHYERILDYIKPDFVHIIENGKIIMEGGSELVRQINKHGYQSILK